MLSIASVYASTRGYYGPSGGWALTVVFSVSLGEWFINTLWARAAAGNTTSLIVVVTFINASAGMLTPALYKMIETNNPDGFGYQVAGNIIYGFGGAFGAYLACQVSHK